MCGRTTLLSLYIATNHGIELACSHVCVFGYVTKEWEVLPEGIVREIVGGGAFFVAVALRSLGACVEMIVRLSEAEKYLLELPKSMGVWTRLIPSPTTMKCRLLYEANGSRTIEVLENTTPFSDEDVELCAYADAIYVGPQTTKDFSLEFIKRASNKAPVYVDAQGFTREVRGAKIEYVDWVWKREAANYIELLKVDDREAKILTGASSIDEALRQLHLIGFKNVLLTTDEGVYLSTGEGRWFARYRVTRVVGRTGRGDTAVAACIYARLAGMSGAETTRFVAAAVSIKLSAPGPLRASKKEVEGLAKEIEVEEL